MLNRTFMRISLGVLAKLAVFILLACPAFAQRLTIPIGKSYTLPANGVTKIIAVKEGVVEVLNVSDNEVILSGVGSEAGVTQIIVWDSAGRRVYDVETYLEAENIEQKFKALFTYGNVSIAIFPDSVFIKGSVANEQQKAMAKRVLGTLLKDRPIVNLTQIETPVVTIEERISSALQLPTVKVTVISNNQVTSDDTSTGLGNLATPTEDVRRIILQGTVDNQNDYIHMVEVIKGFADQGQISNLVTIENPIQVMFQAYVLQVNKRDTKDLGVEWGGAQALGTGLTQGTIRFAENIYDSLRGGVSLPGAKIGKDVNPLRMGNINRFDIIAAHVRALEEKGKVKVLANPKLTVYANASPIKLAHSGWFGERIEPETATSIETDSGLAFVTVGQDILYPTSIDNQGNPTFTTTKADLKLMIRDLFVTNEMLKFSVFAKQDEPSFTRGANAPPDILKRSVMTTIQVPNQETIVLGGLINSSREMSETRIPLLSQLPVLGRLFRRKSYSNRENELVILLTPQIIRRDVNLAGRARFEEVQIPRRTERLEQLHQMFQKIKGNHFPRE